MYELFTSQHGLCATCTSTMSIHELEVDNMLTGGLVCSNCLNPGEGVVSVCDVTHSAIDMDLRPKAPFVMHPAQMEDSELRTAGPPVITRQDTSYVAEASECFDEYLDMQHNPSWHRRVRLCETIELAGGDDRSDQSEECEDSSLLSDEEYGM